MLTKGDTPAFVTDESLKTQGVPTNLNHGTNVIGRRGESHRGNQSQPDNYSRDYFRELGVGYNRGMDVRAYNREAWDHQVSTGVRWTVPVGSEAIARARQGEFDLLLSPMRPVPREWIPPLAGLKTLCLASSGGQQVPLLAAAGARVTALDNSPAQLAQDCLVVDREGLAIETIEGDMADLSQFADESFGLVVNVTSNCFVPEVRPVWRECYRVLEPGGVLLAAFLNPLRFLFDAERTDRIHYTVRYKIPFADERDLDRADLEHLIAESEPLTFGHTLDDQIGGQLAAGFILTGFFEDRHDDTTADPLSNYIATFINTRAVKPARGCIAADNRPGHRR